MLIALPGSGRINTGNSSPLEWWIDMIRTTSSASLMTGCRPWPASLFSAARKGREEGDKLLRSPALLMGPTKGKADLGQRVFGVRNRRHRAAQTRRQRHVLLPIVEHLQQ